MFFKLFLLFIPRNTQQTVIFTLLHSLIRLADRYKSMSSSSPEEPNPSYVKLAMRNMLKKGSTSLKHFALSTLGILVILLGLAYLTR